MKNIFTISFLFFFLMNSAAGVSLAQSAKDFKEASSGLPPHFHAKAESTNHYSSEHSMESDNPEFQEEDSDYLYEDEEDETQSYASDPLKPFNDVMFHFNDKLYFWVLKPIGRGYRAIMPDAIRIGIQNFFVNLSTPIRFVNCLLQAKGDDAGNEFTRLVTNTTVGFLGFWDQAKAHQHLDKKEEDFGQTLGVWGVESGWYIILPFLGPSTLRDSAGRLGDMFLDPLYYLEPAELSLEIWAVDKTNDISFRIGDYETIKEAALDPYESIRDGYLQMRAKKVSQ